MFVKISKPEGRLYMFHVPGEIHIRQAEPGEEETATLVIADLPIKRARAVCWKRGEEDICVITDADIYVMNEEGQTIDHFRGL